MVAVELLIDNFSLTLSNAKLETNSSLDTEVAN